MKTKMKLFVSVLILAAILLVPLSIHNIATGTAAGTVALVSAVDGSSNFNFTSPTKNVGDSFVVNVTIADAVDLGTWQVAIQWDSSLLGFVSMTLPTDHVFAGKSPISSPVIATPGLVIMGVSVGPLIAGFTGSGRLAQLTLNITKAVGTGETVQTDLSYEGMVDDTFLLDSLTNDITDNYAFNVAHYTYSGPAGPSLKHDIAVTSVVPASTSVTQGNLLNISVTISNKGNYTETFSVGVTANGVSVAPNQTATNLASGASMLLTFAWNTAGFAPGSYSIVGLAGPVVNETNVADNTHSGGTIQIVTPTPTPPQKASLTVVNGTSSYYISNLTGIPSSYFIQNGIYAGWCVDKSTVMVRSAAHNVTLYSSLNSTLPAAISGFNWNAVNYILNHKQGSMKQIQDAIWYFVPDNQLPPTNETDAIAMINAALANPQYTPTSGNILAVIAYSGSPSGVQNTIAEYTIP